MRFDAYLLPRLVPPAELQDATVVVVDVLRATTTIATALAAGARRVIPAPSVPQARGIARQRNRAATLLGGERHGLRIPGFALGNSPSEYVPAAVGGRTIVFTTTNGTRALKHCRLARRVLLGALVNFAAVCRRLQACADWRVLCAGTRGEVSCEDVLVAGMLWHAWRVAHRQADRGCWNDQAELAACLAQAAGGGALAEYAAAVGEAGGVPATRPIESARQVLEGSAGGRHLAAIGLSGDIAAAAQLDRLDVVPLWRTTSNQIVAARRS